MQKNKATKSRLSNQSSELESEAANVPSIPAALPAEPLWRAAALGTRLPSARRWLLWFGGQPRSRKPPQEPKVSITTGTNSWAVARFAYFTRFFDSASDAAALDSKADLWTYEGARVSGQVASQSKHLPLTQEIRVAPSGRLASVRVNPDGSRMAGTLALCSARRIVSLSRLWRRWRPALRLQASPWWPSLSTDTPQLHLCSSTSGAPSLSPTATRSALSSRLRPRAAWARHWAMLLSSEHGRHVDGLEQCRRSPVPSTCLPTPSRSPRPIDAEPSSPPHPDWPRPPEISMLPPISSQLDLAVRWCRSGGEGKGVQWHQQQKPRRQTVPADAHYGLLFPPTSAGGRPGPRRMSTDRCWELMPGMFLSFHRMPAAPRCHSMGQCAGCRGAWGWRRRSGAGRALCVPGVAPAGRSLTTDRGASLPAPCLRPCLLGWGCLGEWRPPEGIP